MPHLYFQRGKEIGKRETTVFLSPGKIEVALGGKFVGISAPVSLDLTKGFVTLRLVRYQNSPYVSLFVNDHPLPAITDFPMSGHQMNGASRKMQVRVWFGYVGQRFDASKAPPDRADEYIVVPPTSLYATISDVRWTSNVHLVE